MKRDSREVNLSVSTGTFIRFWLVILGFVGLAGALWLTREPLVILITAVFLALALNRPVSFFARHLPGKSRTLAIFIAFLIVAFLIGMLFMTLIPVFAKQLSIFIQSLPDTVNSLNHQAGWVREFIERYNLTDKVNVWVADIEHQLGNFATTFGSNFFAAVGNVFSILVTLFITLILTFFILIEGPDWEEKFWRLAYRDPVRRRYHKTIAQKMYNVISGYVTGQAVVGLISGTFTAIVVFFLATAFKFDISLVWPAWMTIFMMVFVPMFGAIIGGLVVGLLLAIYSIPAAIIYLVVFTIEQQVENNIIQPRVQARHLDVSALIILVALIFGLQIGGLLGALLSIPVAGCISVLLKEAIRTSSTDSKDNANLEKEYAGNPNVILDSCAPVIFVENKRRYIGPDLPNIKNRIKSRRRRSRSKSN